MKERERKSLWILYTGYLLSLIKIKRERERTREREKIKDENKKWDKNVGQKSGRDKKCDGMGQ